MQSHMTPISRSSWSKANFFCSFDHKFHNEVSRCTPATACHVSLQPASMLPPQVGPAAGDHGAAGQRDAGGPRGGAPPGGGQDPPVPGLDLGSHLRQSPDPQAVPLAAAKPNGGRRGDFDLRHFLCSMRERKPLGMRKIHYLFGLVTPGRCACCLFPSLLRSHLNLFARKQDGCNDGSVNVIFCTVGIKCPIQSRKLQGGADHLHTGSLVCFGPFFFDARRPPEPLGGPQPQVVPAASASVL